MRASNYLVRKIAKERAIDVVLIDMSPNVSATNHCILMGSDYFIVPISPDFYCHQAIDSLSNVLPNWAKNINKFRSKNNDYSLPENNPKCLVLYLKITGFIRQIRKNKRANKKQCQRHIKIGLIRYIIPPIQHWFQLLENIK